MASITYWNRLEPRPRTNSLTRALTAQVRDPMWMLTRQWQFGEYQGEDAASPAFVSTSAETAPVQAWRAGAATPSTFDRLEVPLEPLVEQEPFTPDVSLRVELGQTFRALLDDATLGAHWIAYRTHYRIARPNEAVLAELLDHDHARFLRVAAERSLDGVKLYQDIVAAAPAQPAAPAVPAAVLPVLQAFRAWVESTIGTIGTAEPKAWRPERLEYGVDVIATVPGATPTTAALAAHPGRTGNFDWYSFDVAGPAPPGSPAPAPIASSSVSILPALVRFKGMPNKRWWHFEPGGTDFGDIQADKRDVAKLIVMDFMLVHGNDWFVIPFEMETGTLCRVTSVNVRDVFGGETTVRRADADARPGTDRWSMYSTTRAGSDALADFFLLPPSAGEIALAGEPVEQVRFLRDEMANMVWALEHTVESAAGAPWRGHERDQARRARDEQPHAPTPVDATPLLYRIQTDVPEHWIPFLPVAIDAARRQIALEQGAMLRYLPAPAPPEPILPVGRVLNPSASPYRVREEEVPREGANVDRLVRRARWIDGSAHLWCSRRKTIGPGEGQSGLRFDQAVVRPPPPPSAK